MGAIARAVVPGVALLSSVSGPQLFFGNSDTCKRSYLGESCCKDPPAFFKCLLILFSTIKTSFLDPYWDLICIDSGPRRSCSLGQFTLMLRQTCDPNISAAQFIPKYNRNQVHRLKAWSWVAMQHYHLPGRLQHPSKALPRPRLWNYDPPILLTNSTPKWHKNICELLMQNPATRTLRRILLSVHVRHFYPTIK